jgi:hypothetical protein
LALAVTLAPPVRNDVALQNGEAPAGARDFLTIRGFAWRRQAKT